MTTLEQLVGSERQAPRNKQNPAGSPAIRKLSAAMAALLIAAGCGEDSTVPGPELGEINNDGGRRGDGGIGAAEDATATATDGTVDAAGDATTITPLATDATASVDAGITDTTADTVTTDTASSPADTALDTTATADTGATADSTSSDSGATDTSVAETVTVAETKTDTTAIDAAVIAPNDTAPKTDTYVGPIPADITISKDAAVDPTTPEGKCQMALNEYSDKKGDDTCEEAGVPGVPGSGYKGTMKCVKGNDAPTCVSN